MSYNSKEVRIAGWGSRRVDFQCNCTENLDVIIESLGLEIVFILLPI